MENQDLLRCPDCGATAFESSAEQLSCRGCGRSVPLLLGIPDFRDPARDSTANYPIDDDLRLARLLAAVYPRLATYNEIHLLYEDLIRRRMAGEALNEAMVEEMLASGNYPPRPLSDDQLVHGRAILDKVDQYLADAGESMPPKGVVLENGAGLGLHIDGFATSFERLVVVDFSLVYLILGKKMAEERGHTNVLLVCGSVERLPLRDETIDFIHSNNVVEHITDKAAMFGEARRVLRTGGLLFVLSPNHFTLYIEPHFALPAYGFIPKPIRRFYVARRFGWNIDDVTLLSLGQLRALASAEFDSVRVSFIPRRLKDTVMGGRLRGLVVTGLNAPLIGDAADLLLNKLLLGVMPYHAALCFKRPIRPAPVGRAQKAAAAPSGLAPVR